MGTDARTWQEVAASNRERIAALEHELDRVRENVHDFRAEVQAIRYLAEKVGDLAEDVRRLTNRVEKIASRVMNRPTTSALAVLAQYLGLVVALAALVVATSR